MSSHTGATSGGGVGGSQVPWPTELEASAWTQINRAALGIMPDSIEHVFTDVSPRYMAGYLHGFGYKSTPGRPLLERPLESQRMLHSLPTLPNESWQEIYESLVNQLPPELQARLRLEGQQPFEMRNPDFAALDNVLVKAALAGSQLHALAGEAATRGAPSSLTMLNQLLPFAALKGSLAETAEIDQAMRDYLAQQGANYRDFDSFNNILNSLSNSMLQLEQVHAALRTTPFGAELPSPVKELSASVSLQLDKLLTQLQQMVVGEDMQILRPMLQALHISASALALPHSSAAPLYMALSMASIGLHTSESQTGLIGPHLERLLSALTQGLLPSASSSGTIPSQHLLNMAVTALFAALIGVASQALDPGFGVLPHSQLPVENLQRRDFAFATALHFVAGSKILEQAFEESLNMSGAQAPTVSLGGRVLADAALLLMLFTAARVPGHPTPVEWIENSGLSFEAGLQAAQALSELNESATGEVSEAATAVAIQQARQALAEHHFAALLDIHESLLDNFQVDQGSLFADLDLITHSTAAMWQQIAQSDDDQPLTAIVNIV